MKRNCIAVALLVAMLAGCKGSTGALPGVTALPPASQHVAQAGDCPIVGYNYVNSHASTIFRSALALPGYQASLTWKVSFTNLSKPESPVHYKPWLLVCGPQFGKKPIGTIKLGPGGESR